VSMVMKGYVVSKEAMASSSDSMFAAVTGLIWRPGPSTGGATAAWRAVGRGAGGGDG
jgi:hypothetical protein